MNKIEYTTNSGHEIKIAVTTDYLLDSQGRRKKSGERQVVVTLELDGVNQPLYGLAVKKLSTPMQGCVAKIGNVGLTEKRYDLITKMIEEAELSIGEHNKQLEAHAKKLDSLGSGDINELIAKNS